MILEDLDFKINKRKINLNNYFRKFGPDPFKKNLILIM